MYQARGDESVKLSIIVLTYNALDYTKKCLESVWAHTDVPYELIIIDNNSKDGTQDYLKSIEEEYLTELVLNKGNLGVAGGRNQGIELSTGEFVMFLDNDTEVYEGWIHHVLNEFQDPSIGVVGKNGTNTRSLDPMEFTFAPRVDGRAICDTVPGFCFTFRRKLIELVGKQWEDFPFPKFWHEDLEFCARVRASGYRVVTNEKIPIIHHEHKSMGDDVKGNMSVDAVPGFFENAKYIAKRMGDDNIIQYHRTWQGFDSWSSYDRIARGISEALRSQGKVVVRTASRDSSPFSFNLCKGMDFTYRGKRIACMLLENDRAPMDWKEGSKDFDFIIAGSSHVYNATKDNVFKGKIYDVSPIGIETEIYNMQAPVKKDFYPDKFKFFMLAATQPRKNTESLIEWYVAEFRNNTEVVLILKDGDYGHQGRTAQLIEAKRRTPGCPQIVHLWEKIDSLELASIYRAVAENGVYVHPHKAEGFGMPHIEAAACGCRIITTDFGGPSYNLRNAKGKPYPNVTLLKYTLEPSSFHNHPGEPYYKPTESPNWASPDMMETRKAMREAFEMPYNRNKANILSRSIQARWSYERKAKDLISVLDKICK